MGKTQLITERDTRQAANQASQYGNICLRNASQTNALYTRPNSTEWRSHLNASFHELPSQPKVAAISL